MQFLKKSLGQNFLIDKNICLKISKLININNLDILEIGPGTGNLTDFIIKLNPKKLILLEKDEELYRFLKKKYLNFRNVQIFNIDALEYDFSTTSSSQIISNLPYNISTKIIKKILLCDKYFEKLIFMLQKEVAQKINSKKNTKNNKLNFIIESTSNFKFEFNVSSNVFYPKPKIQSAVISIKPFKSIRFDKKKIEEFANLIFKHKRKKITNVINAANDLGVIYNDKRAEDLQTNEILKLFKKL